MKKIMPIGKLIINNGNRISSKLKKLGKNLQTLNLLLLQHLKKYQNQVINPQ
jgi:hypothetical protein